MQRKKPLQYPPGCKTIRCRNSKPAPYQ
ncbi:MAG: hypothetical protein J7L89_03210 [Bacteroidales bacterium]|nr:hypothetical protein [Bacteroidales bacterium]